jgi:hypothetical protein
MELRFFLSFCDFVLARLNHFTGTKARRRLLVSVAEHIGIVLTGLSWRDLEVFRRDK